MEMISSIILCRNNLNAYRAKSDPNKQVSLKFFPDWFALFCGFSSDNDIDDDNISAPTPYQSGPKYKLG